MTTALVASLFLLGAGTLIGVGLVALLVAVLAMFLDD